MKSKVLVVVLIAVLGLASTGCTALNVLGAIYGIGGRSSGGGGSSWECSFPGVC